MWWGCGGGEAAPAPPPHGEVWRGRRPLQTSPCGMIMQAQVPYSFTKISACDAVDIDARDVMPAQVRLPPAQSESAPAQVRLPPAQVRLPPAQSESAPAQ